MIAATRSRHASRRHFDTRAIRRGIALCGAAKRQMDLARRGTWHGCPRGLLFALRMYRTKWPPCYLRPPIAGLIRCRAGVTSRVSTLLTTRGHMAIAKLSRLLRQTRRGRRFRQGGLAHGTEGKSWAGTQLR